MAWKDLSKPRKISHIALAKTLKLLLNGPASAHEVSEYTGIHLVTAQEWMRSLRKEGVVHVNGWLPDKLGRDATAVFVLGPGKDKPRAKLTPAERQARYKKKIHAISVNNLFAGAPQ
jgi:predicted ArsR family transcriptional regulator